MSYCIWSEDCDGVWSTDCGKSFQFNDGKPRENGAKFCLYCGHKLRQRSYRERRRSAYPTYPPPHQEHGQ